MKRAVFDRAPPWEPNRSEVIMLWHGCTALDRIGVESGLNLLNSRGDLDFGRGFYTTTLRRQAMHWAIRRFDSRHVVKRNNQPAVLRFAVPRRQLARLQSLSFVLAGYENEDYWSFVQHCRQSRGKKRNDHRGPVNEDGDWYDIVSGPVVADWKQRAAFMNMDQMSFHTKQAIALLNAAIKSSDPGRYTWQNIA
jgi:hypothetical protein